MSRDACDVCCRSTLPSPSNLNSVVASLVYGVTAEILKEPGAPSQRLQEAARAQEHVLDAIEFAPGEFSGFSVPACPTPALPTAEAAPLPDQSGGRGRGLAWAVGVLTAPRGRPTLHRTLNSLQEAGFPSVHVFAEPGSWIPQEFRKLPVTTHGQELGNLGNFFTSLVALYMMNPRADCYALFQDDVEAARGLRRWCDCEFWPEDAGLVSLFTSRVYSDDAAGWRVLKLGFFRTYGAQALVFRRDVLEQFLTDGASFRYRKMQADGDDAVVGEWATRAGIGIAYHTPSLVQHVGTAAAISGPGHGVGRASHADAVDSVEQIPAWRPPPRGLGKIGLIGWNTATGLGYLNRDIAAHLPIHKWLVPIHPEYPTLSDPNVTCRIDRVPQTLDLESLKAWLTGLDWVLFAELPYIERFAQYARQQEISVACLPNWEYTNLKLDWVNFVDLMICPTEYTYRLLSDWKHRFGFAWEIIHVPWPIDTGRFEFRCREICRRFLFINGTGGTPALRPDGSLTEYRRKGAEVVFDAASMIPDVPFVVYSQIDNTPPPPRNVELREAPSQNEQLYEDGDVCVQPSRWEGIGLQLLECQAAGMPLVTTDAPPMNEYQPLRTIPVVATEIVSVFGNHPMTSNHVDPAQLAEILAGLYETDISEASRRARTFIEREHSWESAAPLLRGKLRE
ncbi:MAG TPA: glycosyltransferase [Thermoguttaceae bacterium]|nr:glycosyltransferase [Thermoguttaceae bacterium]